MWRKDLRWLSNSSMESCLAKPCLLRQSTARAALPFCWPSERRWCSFQLQIFQLKPKTEMTYTLPETNIAPKNGWLEYYFPIAKAYFSGVMLVSGRVTHRLVLIRLQDPVRLLLKMENDGIHTRHQYQLSQSQTRGPGRLHGFFLVGCLLSLDGKNHKTPKKSPIQLGLTSKPANLVFFFGGGGGGGTIWYVKDTQYPRYRYSIQFWIK